MASAPHSHPPHHVERKGRNALKDLVSGTMGGIAQVLAGHPLDTGDFLIYKKPHNYPQHISEGSSSNADSCSRP